MKMEDENRKQHGKTTLYKDTTTDLNRIHRFLMQRYLLGDTRARYLRMFELALSLNCPDQSLWEMERYKRVSKRYPLPNDSHEYITVKRFYLYLMLYEYIMRDIGLIGKKKEEPVEMKVFNLGE